MFKKVCPQLIDRTMTSTAQSEKAGDQTATIQKDKIYYSKTSFPRDLEEDRFGIIQIDEERDAVTVEGKESRTTTVSYRFLQNEIEKGNVVPLDRTSTIVTGEYIHSESGEKKEFVVEVEKAIVDNTYGLNRDNIAIVEKEIERGDLE